MSRVAAAVAATGRALVRAGVLAAQRFPVPTLFIAVFSLVSNLRVQDIEALSWNDGRLLMGLAGAGLAALAVELAAEARAVPRAVRVVVSALSGAAVLSAIWFSQPFALFAPALVAACVVAVPVLPFIGRGTSAHVWVFALWLNVGLLLAVLAVSAVVGALSAVVEMVRFLFGIGPGWRTYSHLFTTATTLVGPLFALGRVPPVALWDNRLEADDRLVRAIRPLVIWIGAPLVLAVAIVFHVYLLRDLAAGRGDTETVAWVGVCFLVSAWGVRIQVTPFVAAGSFARWFARVWPFILILPALGLLWVGQGSAAAVPDAADYYLALIGATALILAMLQLPGATRGDIRLLLAVPTVLLLLSTGGPFGVGNIVGARIEQQVRAESEAELEQGPEAVNALPWERRSRLASQLEGLGDLRQDARIRRLAPSDRWPIDVEGTGRLRPDLDALLRLHDPGPIPESRERAFTAPEGRVLDTAGYDRLLPRLVLAGTDQIVGLEGLRVRLDGRALEVVASDEPPERFDLGDALAAQGGAVEWMGTGGRQLRVWVDAAVTQDDVPLSVTITLALRARDWTVLR